MMSIILELIKTHHLQGAMDGRNGRNMNQRSPSPILHQFSHTTMHALCCLAPGMLILLENVIKSAIHHHLPAQHFQNIKRSYQRNIIH